MDEKKFYSDVKFVKVENLKGRAKQVANEQGFTEGLALLKISINSVPEYEIELVKDDPLEALKGIGRDDGITPEVLNNALKKAFA